MVTLKAVRHDNWLACIGLEVGEEQRGFVSPNIFSLAEAYVHSDANPADAAEYYRCLPVLVYSGDEPVGFALITYEAERDEDGQPGYEIYRLMIDRRYQRRGYGRAALQLLLAHVGTQPCGNAAWVYASWHPENHASRALFEAFGFEVTGTDDDGAVMARRSLSGLTDGIPESVR